MDLPEGRIADPRGQRLLEVQDGLGEAPDPVVGTTRSAERPCEGLRVVERSYVFDQSLRAGEFEVVPPGVPAMAARCRVKA